ncbi:unnamed protein product, partial [marine sediment metagenome]
YLQSYSPAYFHKSSCYICENYSTTQASPTALTTDNVQLEIFHIFFVALGVA